MVAAVPEGPLVLVIEDDPKAISLLKIYLTEGGYRVAIAGDGAEGLEKVEAAHADVRIYAASVDEGLDERKYIVPGLGDAGDRLYGTA